MINQKTIQVSNQYWEVHRNLHKITTDLCTELFIWFTSDIGKLRGFKTYTANDLRFNLSTTSKPIDRKTLNKAIEQIKEFNLFDVREENLGSLNIYTFINIGVVYAK